jgi:hypothetical protein
MIRITKFLFLLKSRRKLSRQKVLTDSRSSEVAVCHHRFKEEIQRSLLGPWAVINPLKALFLSLLVLFLRFRQNLALKAMF